MSGNLLSIAAAPPLSSSSSSADDVPGRREHVSFPPESQAIVKNISRNQPLNLITIWGPARMGKSFFMNTLAETETSDVFPVRGGVDPCTVGALIATTTRSLSTWKQSAEPAARSWWKFGLGGRSAADEADELSPPALKPDVGFVDVEGQGDKHLSYDILLATPLLLVSKVVIFNWMGAPNKSFILDRLGAMTHAASTIARAQRENAFGHLIVLLRDIPSTEEEKAKALLFNDEDAGSANTDQEQEHIDLRNKTRGLLRLAFRSTRVCCLPRPHPEIGESEVSQGQISPAFAERVAGLRRVMADELIHDPHLVGGQPVKGGAVLTSLLTTVCDAVNGGSQILQPLSIMESVQHGLAETARLKTMEEFNTAISSLDGPDSMSKAATTMSLKKAKLTAESDFRNATKGLTAGAVSKATATLTHAISEVLEKFDARQKARRADALANILRLSHLCSILAGSKVHEIKALLPMSANELSSQWDSVCEQLHTDLQRQIDGSVGADLREDLQSSIPTLLVFKKSVEGKFKGLLDTNQARVVQQQQDETIAEEREEREKLKQEMTAAKAEAEESKRTADRVSQELGRRQDAAAWGNFGGFLGGLARQFTTAPSRGRREFRDTYSPRSARSDTGSLLRRPGSARWDRISPAGRSRSARLDTMSPVRQSRTQHRPRVDRTISPVGNPQDSPSSWRSCQNTLSPTERFHEAGAIERTEASGDPSNRSRRSRRSRSSSRLSHEACGAGVGPSPARQDDAVSVEMEQVRQRLARTLNVAKTATSNTNNVKQAHDPEMEKLRQRIVRRLNATKSSTSNTNNLEQRTGAAASNQAPGVNAGFNIDEHHSNTPAMTYFKERLARHRDATQAGASDTKTEQKPAPSA